MRTSASRRARRSVSSRAWRGERAGFMEGGDMDADAGVGDLAAATSALERARPTPTGSAFAVPLPSANRTPQLGHWSAVAGTEALHTGHSYSVDSPSEISAPQPGQTVVLAATRVSHTGHRNFSPSSGGVALTDVEVRAATTSPDSGVFLATLLRDSMISRWSSLPSMIEARISSMLRPSLTGTSTVSWDPPARSNKVRSVWHEGQTRASTSTEESQTGQTFVSFGGVSRHLEFVDAFLILDKRTKTFRTQSRE